MSKKSAVPYPVGGEFLFIRQKAFEKDQYSEVQGVAD